MDQDTPPCFDGPIIPSLLESLVPELKLEILCHFSNHNDVVSLTQACPSFFWVHTFNRARIDTSVDINNTAITLNRVIKNCGINLYRLINLDIDFLEYWVSGPRPPNLEAALLNLLNQRNQRAPLLTSLQCAALDQLKVVLCYRVGRKRYEVWTRSLLYASHYLVKTKFDEEGYGLICPGVGCTEFAFDIVHRTRCFNALAKNIRDEDKETQDSKKQHKYPELHTWRQSHNRRYLTIVPVADEEYDVLEERHT